MAMRCEQIIDIPQSPSVVFALLDDVTQTPKWLAPCVGIEVKTPGPMQEGTKLIYTYREGTGSKSMDGHITDRAVNEKLAYRYDDKAMGLTLSFVLHPTGTGTLLKHVIEVTPKTTMSKLFLPAIRLLLPKQTKTAMKALRDLLSIQ